MTPTRPFPVTLPIDIAWGEQDAFGHLNNVAYLRYFESVRMHFLERTGILRSHAELGIGVILASTQCDFLRPVHWPARLLASTGCTAIGNTSFTLTYQLEDELGHLVAKGTCVLVMYDYRAGHKVPVPAPIREAIDLIHRT